MNTVVQTSIYDYSSIVLQIRKHFSVVQNIHVQKIWHFHKYTFHSLAKSPCCCKVTWIVTFTSKLYKNVRKFEVKFKRKSLSLLFVIRCTLSVGRNYNTCYHSSLSVLHSRISNSDAPWLDKTVQRINTEYPKHHISDNLHDPLNHITIIPNESCFKMTLSQCSIPNKSHFTKCLMCHTF